jgi:2-polyprenyl-3-methyl-5-hydroxy-6-metoxy-1,4-benzoquinol methylase
MVHDLSFYSGERQTAQVYQDIRADHRYRYEWANGLIPLGGFGLDIFCGNGYGSHLLSQTRDVIGIDGCKEAVDFAALHFSGPRVRYAYSYWPFSLPIAAFDFVVALESIEHVEDWRAFFSTLSRSVKPGGLLIFSTPNEDILPHRKADNHFHFKHFTFEETLAIPASEGLQILTWAGQDTYSIKDNVTSGVLADHEMILNNQKPGQFNIVACHKPLNG